MLKTFASIYGPHVKYYALQIQHLISLILLKLQNHMFLVSLQSNTQLIIHLHVCINTLNSVLLHLQL